MSFKFVFVSLPNRNYENKFIANDGGFATLRRLNEIVDFSTWKTKTPEASLKISILTIGKSWTGLLDRDRWIETVQTII